MVKIEDIINIAKEKQETKPYYVVPQVLFSSKKIPVGFGAKTLTFFDTSKGQVFYDVDYEDTNLITQERINFEKLLIYKIYHEVVLVGDSPATPSEKTEDDWLSSIICKIFINDRLKSEVVLNKKKTRINWVENGTGGVIETTLGQYFEDSCFAVPIVISSQDRFRVEASFLDFAGDVRTSTDRVYLRIYLEGYAIKKNYNPATE